MYLSTCVEGDDTYGKLVRRTIVRYLTLGSIIVFQSTSVCVKKRFPTMEHIIEAGENGFIKSALIKHVLCMTIPLFGLSNIIFAVWEILINFIYYSQ